MNKIDKLKQLVLGVNATFHNVMMTPRIPHAENPAPEKLSVTGYFGTSRPWSTLPSLVGGA